jgi:hypothetical protein
VATVAETLGREPDRLALADDYEAIGLQRVPRDSAPASDERGVRGV